MLKRTDTWCFSLLLLLFSARGFCATEEQPAKPWLDTTHETITETTTSMARWFDSFFLTEDQPVDEDAIGEAQIRLGWEPRSRELSEFETRVRLRMRLPNLKNRAELVFSDYDNDELEQDSALQNSRRVRGDAEDRYSLAFKWDSFIADKVDHRIGIGRRLQPFVRSRYRDQWLLNDWIEMEWQNAVYYYTRDALGAETSLKFGFKLSNSRLLRFNNHFYFRDKTDDWLWRHNVQQYKVFDEKTALITGLYVEGLSRPNYRVEEYLVSMRLRRNTLRDWLFYEVEPFVMWRRDEHFSASYGIALRVEGYFSPR